MSDEHPHRRYYDKSHWPMKSDGNGNFLLGRNTTYVSLALVVILVIGAIQATRDVTELRGAIDYAVEQAALRSAEIMELREDQRKFEKVVSDTMSRIQIRIAVLEHKIDKMERPRNTRAKVNNAHRR